MSAPIINQSTGESLAGCVEFAGLLYRVHAHSSCQLGTTVRPLDDEFREGYDIDLAARLTREDLLRYCGPNGPASLIDHLYVALKRYADRQDLRIERNDRCVTMTYAGGIRSDYAPIIETSLHSRLEAKFSRGADHWFNKYKNDQMRRRSNGTL